MIVIILIFLLNKVALVSQYYCKTQHIWVNILCVVFQFLMLLLFTMYYKPICVSAYVDHYYMLMTGSGLLVYLFFGISIAIVTCFGYTPASNVWMIFGCFMSILEFISFIFCLKAHIDSPNYNLAEIKIDR